MNKALQTSLDRVQEFDATHHRPMRIMNMDDAEVAESRSHKVRKGRKASFKPDADPFRRGLSFKYWNHYHWVLDITEFINEASPGYLVHLAGVDAIYAEPLRERWQNWCRLEENYIPQGVRQNFWDYWQAWVDAGELARFKDDIYVLRGDIVRPYFTDVFCMSPECQFPNLTYQIRYTMVRTDNGLVVGMIPTVDDKHDPDGEAGQYLDSYVIVRRKCPWCGSFNKYQVEVTK
jgi:hypothetical protein